MKKSTRILLLTTLMWVSGSASSQTLDHKTPKSAKEPVTGGSAVTSVPTQIFARVNGTDISFDEFNRSAQENVRKKYYHAQPPEDEIAGLLRDTGQGLIDQILLREDVKRRKVIADTASVDAQIAAYEKQYSASPAWKQQREQTLPKLREFLTARSQLEVLEKQMRKVATPEREVRAYYDANNDKFTEPEKVKLSIILLRVDPSSGAKAWEATRQEADKIYKQLKSGTDFAEMAKLRSQDGSAQNGGNLGYVHRGMLGDEVHQQIDKLKIGDIAEPVVVLEGVLIFRLEGRKLPNLRDYAEVKDRARSLLEREKAEDAWQTYLKQLRKAAKVEFSAQGNDIMRVKTPAPKK